MFQINAEQVQDMRAVNLEAFLSEMEAWAVEHHGPEVARLGEGMIRDEVLRARALGFRLRGHAKRWLTLGLTFGMPLAEQDWAAETAGCEALSPAGRLHILEREATFALLELEEEARDAV